MLPAINSAPVQAWISRFSMVGMVLLESCIDVSVILQFIPRERARVVGPSLRRNAATCHVAIISSSSASIYESVCRERDVQSAVYEYCDISTIGGRNVDPLQVRPSGLFLDPLKNAHHSCLRMSS